MDIETKPSAPEKHADTLRDSSFQGGEDRKDDNISVLDLLIVLAERKRIIAWFTLTSLVLAVIVSLLMPKRYTATVTLLPPQQNSTLSGVLASQLGNLGNVAALAGGSLGIRNPNEMYVAMFKSETVENAMVKHFGLMERYHERYLSSARKHFESNTTVSGDGKDGLIHISVEDGDPRRAAELANGYMDQFRDLSQHLAITEAGQRALFFKQQLEQAKDNLANAEQSLAQTEQETGLIQVDSQARALIESAAALNGQIAAKEVQIQAMQTYATGQNAQLIQAQQELDGLRAQLAKLGGSQDLSSGGILVPKGQVPKASLEYIRKLREVKSDETIFEVLVRQFELAKLDEAKEGALIQVVDPAIPPDRRSSPKRTLIVIGATFVGFLVGILWALGQSALERLKEDPETSSKLAFLSRALFFRRRENLPGGQARI
jgi:tyrosine-protein kinase Etk/Wzc